MEKVSVQVEKVQAPIPNLILVLVAVTARVSNGLQLNRLTRIRRVLNGLRTLPVRLRRTDKMEICCTFIWNQIVMAFEQKSKDLLFAPKSSQ